MAKKIKNKKTKNSNSNSYADNLQTALLAAGMVPGWGAIPDLLNTGISATRAGYNKLIGDDQQAARHSVNTGVNATAIIPGVGQGVALAKLSKLGYGAFGAAIKQHTKKNLPAVIKKGANEVTKKTGKKNLLEKGVGMTKNSAKKVKETSKKGWEGYKDVMTKHWKTAAGLGGGMWAYDIYSNKKKDAEYKEYLKKNPEHNRGARYEEGGVAPEVDMQSMQESIDNGQEVQLPGGTASPIAEGSSAVKFEGQTHEENNGSNSGILIDNAEVENNETQDQVTMRDGGKKDYFFSSHLKNGGVSFADRHESIVKNGDNQEEKDELAREQEITAGRDPKIVARKGGFRKFNNGGGYSWDLTEELNKNKKDTDGDGIPDISDEDLDGDGVPNGIDSDPSVKSKDPEKAGPKKANTESPNQPNQRFNAYGDEYSKVSDASSASGYEGYGADGSYKADDLGEPGIAGTQKGSGAGYYGEVGGSNMEDFFNRNKDLMKEMGINSAEEFDPKKHTQEFQNKFNAQLKDRYKNDPDFKAQLDEQGISEEQLLQQSGFHGKGATSADGKMGEFTWSKTSMGKKTTPESEDTPEEGDPTGDGNTTVDGGSNSKSRKRWGDGVDLSMLQFLPAAVAMTDKPDYMDAPDVIVPPTVRAERIKADKMDMQNFNADRAAVDMDAANFDRFVETSGGGASNYANKMANQTSKFKQRMAITAAETKANVNIQGQNVANKLNADATNQGKALEASTTNAAHQSAAAEANTKNKMYVNEFNKGADAATFDRKLGALDTMTQGAMTMQMAREKNNTDMAIAEVQDGSRNAWERYQGEVTKNKQLNTGYDKANEHLKKLLKDKGVKEGSEEWNKYV